MIVRNRTKPSSSFLTSSFSEHRRTTLNTKCGVENHRAMTLKKQQQHQQHQQQPIRLVSSSPPPIPQVDSNSPPTSSNSSNSSSLQPNQSIEDHPWGKSTTRHSSPSPMETVNDRFIHESGPPTALSILRTQPAFIGKLYKMLEDTTQDLICWSNNGEYFSVYNSALFSRQILPQYFKHNNWQSFVRQLNMYGFSKINEMIHSNLSFDNQTWDFKHPHFKRGDFQSLSLVKRKSVRSSPMASTGSSSVSTASSSTPYHPSNSVKVNTTDETYSHDKLNQTLFTPPAPQQHPYQQDSIDDNGGVENRVMQLDEQVNQVSNSVSQLTTELREIRDLIYKQQEMIHDLANLFRSRHDPSSSSAAAAQMVAMVSSGMDGQRTTSLPSIHSLASDLQHSANIDSNSIFSDRHGYHHHQQHPFSPYQPNPQQQNPYSSPHIQRIQPHHQQQQQHRRSSHPSGNSSRASNHIYPLLNSVPDEEDAEEINDYATHHQK